MSEVAFCTCTNTRCPHHPGNQPDGCTRCVEKNLNRGEIPSCFFNKLDGSGVRENYKFADFARLVLEKQEENKA